MIKWILLGIFVWTISSLVWGFFALGRKTQPNRWWDYPLAPPVLAIAYIFGTIKWLRMRFGKTVPPVVVIDDGVYKGDYKQYRQIRVTSEQNIDWTINIYSESPMKIEMWNDRDGTKYES